MKSTKKRPSLLHLLRNALPILFALAIGAGCGFLLAPYADAIAVTFGAHSPLLLPLALFAVTYVLIYLHLILHEAGHLLCGLLTGYRFLSFRIGSLMLLRMEGKLRLKRLSIAGTGGQCLLSPPDWQENGIPFVLYNLGGSLMNLFTALLAIILALALRDMPFFAMTAWIFVIAGIVIGLTNGIPLRMGLVDNDGRNAVSMGKHPAALRAFWLQLKVNEACARGVRLKDMPAQWFDLPDGGDLSNAMVMTIAVFACNRLMDAQDFDAAREKIDALLHGAHPMIGLYRQLLECDRLYCELIGENNPTKVSALYTKPLQKFMKAMKSYPSVIRTNYVYALLHTHDADKAAAFKAQFEKCAARYPYASDIASERELIAHAETHQ